MDQILEMFRGNRTPPTLKEVSQELDTTIDAVTSLVRFATQQRILIDLNHGFFIADDAFQTLCRELRELFDASPRQSVAGIRDHWNVTRKHAIPLLEYCDQIAITVRQDDVRVPGTALDHIVASPPLEDQTSLTREATPNRSRSED